MSMRTCECHRFLLLPAGAAALRRRGAALVALVLAACLAGNPIGPTPIAGRHGGRPLQSAFASQALANTGNVFPKRSTQAQAAFIYRNTANAGGLRPDAVDLSRRGGLPQELSSNARSVMHLLGHARALLRATSQGRGVTIEQITEYYRSTAQASNLKEGFDELVHRGFVTVEKGSEAYRLTARGEAYLTEEKSRLSASVKKSHFSDASTDAQARILQFINQRDWLSIIRSGMAEIPKNMLLSLRPEVVFGNLSEFENELTRRAGAGFHDPAQQMRWVKLWIDRIVSEEAAGRLRLPPIEHRVELWERLRKTALGKSAEQRLTRIFQKIYFTPARSAYQKSLLRIVQIVQSRFKEPTVDPAMASAAFHTLCLEGVADHTLVRLAQYFEEQIERKIKRARAASKAAKRTPRNTSHSGSIRRTTPRGIRSTPARLSVVPNGNNAQKANTLIKEINDLRIKGQSKGVKAKLSSLINELTHSVGNDEAPLYEELVKAVAAAVEPFRLKPEILGMDPEVFVDYVKKQPDIRQAFARNLTQILYPAHKGIDGRDMIGGKDLADFIKVKGGRTLEEGETLWKPQGADQQTDLAVGQNYILEAMIRAAHLALPFGIPKASMPARIREAGINGHIDWNAIQLNLDGWLSVVPPTGKPWIREAKGAKARIPSNGPPLRAIFDMAFQGLTQSMLWSGEPDAAYVDFRTKVVNTFFVSVLPAALRLSEKGWAARDIDKLLHAIIGPTKEMPHARIIQFLRDCAAESDADLRAFKARRRKILGQLKEDRQRTPVRKRPLTDSTSLLAPGPSDLELHKAVDDLLSVITARQGFNEHGVALTAQARAMAQARYVEAYRRFLEAYALATKDPDFELLGVHERILKETTRWGVFPVGISFQDANDIHVEEMRTPELLGRRTWPSDLDIVIRRYGLNAPSTALFATLHPVIQTIFEDLGVFLHMIGSAPEKHLSLDDLSSRLGVRDRSPAGPAVKQTHHDSLPGRAA